MGFFLRVVFPNPLTLAPSIRSVKPTVLPSKHPDTLDPRDLGTSDSARVRCALPRRAGSGRASAKRGYTSLPAAVQNEDDHRWRRHAEGDPLPAAAGFRLTLEGLQHQQVFLYLLVLRTVPGDVLLSRTGGGTKAQETTFLALEP